MNRMPVIFVGHGSPMNALGENIYTRAWESFSKKFPKPRAILSISAHWYTKGSYLTAQEFPPQIYDFYGFPQELYDIKYQVKGDKDLVERVNALVEGAHPVEEHGIDHGTWCPLRFFYPKADVPVIQLSVNGYANAKEIIEIGRSLKSLRDEGILLFASGNIVHNLRLIDWGFKGGFDWAHEFDGAIKEAIINRDLNTLENYEDMGESAVKSYASKEHFLPLLYAFGATDEKDSVKVFSEVFEMGAVSMTSYYWDDLGGE
ncbi:MAG: 4,5-DOPA dioxygenase extradiol [Gallicola sp.]|nr:4,5-DOPA dioxygenase extradiol [Gallicola sp.]